MEGNNLCNISSARREKRIKGILNCMEITHSYYVSTGSAFWCIFIRVWQWTANALKYQYFLAKGSKQENAFNIFKSNAKNT